MHVHIIVQVVVILAVTPLILLAIGFLILEIATALRARSNYDSAVPLLKVSMQLMGVFRLGPIRNFQTLPRTLLGETLMLSGKYSEAEKHYAENALRASQGRGGKDIIHEGHLSQLYRDVGISRYDQGLYPAAFASLSKALILLLREEYPEDTTVGIPQEDEEITPQRAVTLAELAIRQIRQNEILLPIRVRTILYLGFTLCHMGEVPAGINLIEFAHKVLEEKNGKDCPDMFEAYFDYALILRDNGDMEKARANFKIAQDISNNSFNYKNPKVKRVQKHAQSFK